MSEVYIRSQNKEKLYRMGGDYACIEYREYGDVKKKRHTICISDGCLEEIAEYESKERCIEVLDEIEKICGQYSYAAGSLVLIRGSEDVTPMEAVIPRMYQMPEK